MIGLTRIWVIIVVILTLSLAGALLLLFQRGFNLQATTTPAPTNSALVSPAPTEQINDNLTATPSASASVPANWRTFNSSEYGFSIRYPQDIKAETRVGEEGVRFLKLGPTQTEGTELFDAISLNISSGTLNNQSLRQYVDLRQQQIRNEPAIESVGQVEQVNIAGYTGFRFPVRGLGDFNYIYLPRGSNQYLLIINSTVDPGNRGYTQTVNQMLSTLKINS